MDHRNLYKSKTIGDKNTKTKRIERLKADRTANRNDLHQMGRNFTIDANDVSINDEDDNYSPVKKVPQVKLTRREEYIRKFAAWKEDKMKKKEKKNATIKPAFCSSVNVNKTFVPMNYAVFKPPASVKIISKTIAKPRTPPKPIKKKLATKSKPVIQSSRVTRSNATKVTEPVAKPVQITKKLSVKVTKNTNHLVQDDKSVKQPLKLKILQNPELNKEESFTTVTDNFSFSVDGTKITSTSRKSKSDVFTDHLIPVEIPFEIISPIDITPIKPNKSAELNESIKSSKRKRQISPEKMKNNCEKKVNFSEKTVQNPLVLLEKIKNSFKNRKTLITVHKDENIKKKEIRKSMPMKIDGEVPVDLNETPVNNNANTSLTYLSPFVSTARGKGSAKREKRKRNSVYKPNGSIEEPIELRQGREAGTYFRKVLQNEIDRLLSLCDEWIEYKLNNETNLISDHIDSIDVAIGQAKLLMNKKFEQFKTLIVQCEQYTGEQKVLPEDLEGFWAMVYMQVENIDKRFTDLGQWRDKGWEEPVKNVEKIVKRKKKTSVHSPANVKTRTTLRKNAVDRLNPIKNLIRRARNELIEKNKNVSDYGGKNNLNNEIDGLAINNNEMEMFKNSPIRSIKERKSLLTSVLLSETRKSSGKRLKICKNKENLNIEPKKINDIDQPIKSILKTPGVTRKEKGVVFTEPKNYVTPINTQLRFSSPSSCSMDDDSLNDIDNNSNKKRSKTNTEKYRMTPHNKKNNSLTPISKSSNEQRSSIRIPKQRELFDE